MESAQPKPELTGQRLRVFQALAGREWRPLPEISALTGDSQNSVSAQIRFLKRSEWGGYQVLKRRRGREASGLFEYWLVTK
jgi:biotin operon repressor